MSFFWVFNFNLLNPACHYNRCHYKRFLLFTYLHIVVQAKRSVCSRRRYVGANHLHRCSTQPTHIILPTAILHRPAFGGDKKLYTFKFLPINWFSFYDNYRSSSSHVSTSTTAMGYDGNGTNRIFLETYLFYKTCTMSAQCLPR